MLVQFLLVATAICIPKSSPEVFIGSMLHGKYLVNSTISKTRNSVVFSGTYNNTTYAIKCLLYDKQFATNEISIMQQLSHPNIVKFIDAFQESEYHFIVMEMCDLDVNQLYKTGGYNPFSIFNQVLEGLIYLHKKGIYHRDLKPGNILLVKDKDRYIAKIADFGWSTRTELSNGLEMGTASYMSPEIIQGQSRISWAKNDVWSLLTVLVVLCIKRPVWPDPSYALENIEYLRKRYKFTDELMLVFKRGFGKYEDRPTAIQLKEMIASVLASRQKILLDKVHPFGMQSREN